jgi:hypothetical protein
MFPYEICHLLLFINEALYPKTLGGDFAFGRFPYLILCPRLMVIVKISIINEIAGVNSFLVYVFSV